MKTIHIYIYKEAEHHPKIAKPEKAIFSTKNIITSLTNKRDNIFIYDKTYIEKDKDQKIIHINNHINKSGESPLLKSFKVEKKFYDITQIYKQHPLGVVATGLGNRYEKNKTKHKHPCQTLPLVATLLYVNGFKNIYGRLINTKN